MPILSVALVLAVIAVAILIWGKNKRKSALSSSKVWSMWKTIDMHAKDANLIVARQAIVEADKLLDEILKSKVGGKDMGERLRNAQGLFKHRQFYQNAWEAHKVRNKLVHEVGFEINKAEIGQVIANFKGAITGLGY